MLGRPAQVERPAVHHEQRRGVPVATTACSSSSCRPGRSSEERDAASPIMFCHSPTTTTATSASVAERDRRGELGLGVEALRVRPARCRRTCRTSTGTCAAHGRTPGRVRRRAPVAGAWRGCRRARSRSRRGRSRRPTGRGCRAWSRRAGRCTAIESRPRRPAAAGRPRSSAAPPRARRRRGDLAVRRVAEDLAGAVLVHVRIVEQAEADLGLEHPAHGRVEVVRAGGPAASASGRCAKAGSVMTISMSMPAFSARAAGVGEVGARSRA